MAASKSEIEDWFNEGHLGGFTHLIVVCDTFDHEDYPIYASNDDECLARYDKYNGGNMQRVMEVYDLRENKSSQLEKGFTMRLPPRRAVAD